MTQLTRRRFLSLTAAALATPASAAPTRWHGHALGAEVGLTIHAPAPLAEKAIRQTRARLAEIEELFSLYDPASLLSQLNRNGFLRTRPAVFQTLVDLCTEMHGITEGVFDPTVQTLFRRSADTSTVGWQHVQIGKTLRLGRGQHITLNGIAQGFATDLIRADLAQLGLQQALVNIGEFSALGGPFTLGIADPDQGWFATRTLSNRAIATSSPGAMRLFGGSHIRHPQHMRTPLWATVSVESTTAAVADAASTAFCLMTQPEIERSLARLPEEAQVVILSHDGEILTL